MVVTVLKLYRVFRLGIYLNSVIRLSCDGNLKQTSYLRLIYNWLELPASRYLQTRPDSRTCFHHLLSRPSPTIHTLHLFRVEPSLACSDHCCRLVHQPGRTRYRTTAGKTDGAPDQYSGHLSSYTRWPHKNPSGGQGRYRQPHPATHTGLATGGGGAQVQVQGQVSIAGAESIAAMPD